VDLDTRSPQQGRLPLVGLSALAVAGFLTILTEALPAGLLPRMSSVSTADWTL
jgi:predicted MFS family arabinose efflux permease